jgi:hypothetical protein
MESHYPSGVPFSIPIREKALIRVLAWVTASLVAAHLVGVALLAAFGEEALHRRGLVLLIKQFNLDEEMNVPTYFSCFLLATAGLLLWIIARRVRETGQPMLLQWRVLSVIFFAMSFDEFASIHEHIGDVLKRLHAPEHGAMHFTWVVAGLPFVAVVGAMYLPFLLALPRRFRNPMFLAGVVYVSGALGMELLDGWYADLHGENTTYLLLTAIEETLEMAGATLFIRCLLQYLGEEAGEIRVVLRPAVAVERPEGRSTGEVQTIERTPARSL